MSDDVSMKALTQSFAVKTKAIIEAGCDLVLHCNGEMNEMLEINSALPNLNENFLEKFVK
jgi:beta-N-acetylhexosaminidase